MRNSYTFNQYDRLKTRLPAHAVFENGNSKGKKEDCYPLQTEEGVLSSYDLKIVYDREKTGFEDESEMPIVIN